MWNAVLMLVYRTTTAVMRVEGRKGRGWPFCGEWVRMCLGCQLSIFCAQSSGQLPSPTLSSTVTSDHHSIYPPCWGTFNQRLTQSEGVTGRNMGKNLLLS